MSLAAIFEKLDSMRQLLPAQGEVTPAGLRLYARAISDIPLADIDRAIDRALAVCEFFPPPAKLRELAGVARPEDAAVHAWGVAFAAIGEHGAYRSVAFEDPLITAAVRHLGGWEVFCGMTSDDVPFRRRDFERAYAAFARSGISPEQAAHLPGLHERSGTEIEPQCIGVTRRLPPAQAAQIAEARRPPPKQLAAAKPTPEQIVEADRALRALLDDPTIAPALRDALAAAMPKGAA